MFLGQKCVISEQVVFLVKGQLAASVSNRTRVTLGFLVFLGFASWWGPLMKTLAKVKSDRRVRKQPRFCCINTKSCVRCLCPFFNFNWTSVIHCCPLAPFNQYVIPRFSLGPSNTFCNALLIRFTTCMHTKWECLLCDLLLLCFVVVRNLDVEVFMLEKLDHWSWNQRVCLINIYDQSFIKRVILETTGLVYFCLWHPLWSPLAVVRRYLYLCLCCWSLDGQDEASVASVGTGCRPGRFGTVSFDTQEVCTHTLRCVFRDGDHSYVGVSGGIKFGYVLEFCLTWSGTGFLNSERQEDPVHEETGQGLTFKTSWMLYSRCEQSDWCVLGGVVGHWRQLWGRRRQNLSAWTSGVIWSPCFLQKVPGSTATVISAPVPPRSPWPFSEFGKKEPWLFGCFLFTLLDFILTQARVSALCYKPSRLTLNSTRYGCVASRQLRSHFDRTHHSSRCVWCPEARWRGLTWKYEMIWLVFHKRCKRDRKAGALCLDGFTRNPFPIAQCVCACVCVCHEHPDWCVWAAHPPNARTLSADHYPTSVAAVVGKRGCVSVNLALISVAWPKPGYPHRWCLVTRSSPSLCAAVCLPPQLLINVPNIRGATPNLCALACMFDNWCQKAWSRTHGPNRYQAAAWWEHLLKCFRCSTLTWAYWCCGGDPPPPLRGPDFVISLKMFCSARLQM